MPRLRRMKSRLVLANVSRPRLPSITMSPAAGVSRSTIAAPHVPFTKAFPSTTPFKMPYGWRDNSPYPGANVIGACMIVTPAARAASTSATVLSNIPVFSMTGATAPCRTPPSVVNSFWYSISTTAVLAGSSSNASDMPASCGPDHSAQHATGSALKRLTSGLHLPTAENVDTARTPAYARGQEEVPGGTATRPDALGPAPAP